MFDTDAKTTRASGERNEPAGKTSVKGFTFALTSTRLLMYR